MELDRIEKLMEQYFEAVTSPEEEKELRAYFSGRDVADHLKPYTPMFRYFDEAKEERFNKEVFLKPLSGGSNRRGYLQWGSVAAVTILVFGLYIGAKIQEQRKVEYAYAETKKALNLLAENLNRGTEKIAYLTEFEEAKRKIYNHE